MTKEVTHKLIDKVEAWVSQSEEREALIADRIARDLLGRQEWEDYRHRMWIAELATNLMGASYVDGPGEGLTADQAIKIVEEVYSKVGIIGPLQMRPVHRKDVRCGDL